MSICPYQIEIPPYVRKVSKEKSAEPTIYVVMNIETDKVKKDKIEKKLQISTRGFNGR